MSGLDRLDNLAGENAFWNEVKYTRSTKIFREAEPAEYVYQIREGAIRSYKLLSDGRRQIGAFHLPGDIFGIENDDVHRFTAETIVNTTVWIARRGSLLEELGKSDVAATNKIRDLVTRSLEHVENHLLLLGRQTSLEKVAAFLIEMDRRLDAPMVMSLPMGRRDIADYLGMTLETVSRSLSMLRDEGVLSFTGQTQREIVLEDRPKLAEMVVTH